MLKKYTTVIQHNQEYPFTSKSSNLPNFHYDVRIIMPIKIPFSYNYFQKKLNKIVDLQSLTTSLISLTGVIQQRTQNHFILIYEQIPYSLQDIFDLKIQLQKVETKIISLCQFLLYKKIIPKIQTKYFGINQKNQIKYLILPDFNQIYEQKQLKRQLQRLPQKVKNSLKKLRLNSPISPRQTIQDDKTSQRVSERDLSAYNKKFQQKIAKIQSKLQLNNGRLNSGQKLKRKKKLSQNLTQQSISGSSSSQKSLNVTENKVKSYIQKNRLSYTNDRMKQYSKTQNQKFYKTSNQASKQVSKQSDSIYQNQQQNDQSDNKVMKSSKLTNSLIIEQKNEQMQKLKQHKSSFGDYSNYGNQSQKQVKLKRRITCALEKSRYALKAYEKYQIMKSNFMVNKK